MKIFYIFLSTIFIIQISISCRADKCEDIILDMSQSITNCPEGEDKITTCDDDGQCEIFKQVSNMPSLNGCTYGGSIECSLTKTQEFLNENIVYPSCAIENGIEGKVKANFIVLKSGCLVGIRVFEDIGYGCGKEVQRAISTMPAWKSGSRHNGELVDVQLTIEYVFKI